MPNHAASYNMPSTKQVYRHRAGFSQPNDVRDNMWSVIPNEDDAHYPQHGRHFHALDGE